MRAGGVRTAAVTHAAGLSSTGDAALDAQLPLPERFEVPPGTAAAVRRTRALGGRVVAVGTTVVRALESAAADGKVEARAGVTALVIGPGHRPRAVDGIFTGLHEPGSSHFALLGAFAPAAHLEAAFRAAESAGYLAHEFGDAMLILPGTAP